MANLPTVAVAGATGLVGKHIVNALVGTSFRSKFKDIILLSRQRTSPQLDQWVQEGAELRTYSEGNLIDCLRGIDVIINA